MPHKTTMPITSRECLSAAKDLVGKTWLIKLFSVGERTIERWLARPGYVDEDSIRENPMEKFERLLARLMDEPGGPDIAVASVDRLALIVGCSLVGLYYVIKDLAVSAWKDLEL